MLEPGEDAAFLFEAAAQRGAIHRAADELDGHLLLVDVVGAAREVDRAHASVADLADQAIRAHLIGRTADEHGGGGNGARNAIALAGVLQQAFHLLTDCRRAAMPEAPHARCLRAPAPHGTALPPAPNRERS